MNISEAKNQIKETVRAYMSKDDTGAYLIDVAHQRPLFLIGAPGIGKTAIVEQVASELGIGLVSYSMTHHTRQSALGLPFIEHKTYGSVTFDVSEYTMSEIIASMYDYMEKTGLRKGILFLDEINCVSETLYPSMLQFLQFKTFGRHSIPEDWIVVCAGNPPEYNRSVHEFDIVTMDRLRRIDIEPEYAAWKNYAVDQGLHPAVTSYLEVRHDDFYMVEAKLGGKSFVTARGWEDLARTITLFEQQGTLVNAALIEQFLQDAEIAERFAAYYDLFNKYRSDYQIDAILTGQVDESIIERAQAARFDERLALLGLLLDSLGGTMFDIVKKDEALTMVRNDLSELKDKMRAGDDLFAYVGAVTDRVEGKLAHSKDIGTASAQATRSLRLEDALLHEMMAGSAAGEHVQVYAAINQVYRHHAEQLNEDVAEAQKRLDNAFAFIDKAFNQKRELLVFVTELTARQTTVRFLNRFGSDSYFAHNQDLLVEDNRQKIAERISELPVDRIAATVGGQQNPMGLSPVPGTNVSVIPIALSAETPASHGRHAAAPVEETSTKEAPAEPAEDVPAEETPAEPAEPTPAESAEDAADAVPTSEPAEDGEAIAEAVADDAAPGESADEVEELIADTVDGIGAFVGEVVSGIGSAVDKIIEDPEVEKFVSEVGAAVGEAVAAAKEELAAVGADALIAEAAADVKSAVSEIISEISAADKLEAEQAEQEDVPDQAEQAGALDEELADEAPADVRGEVPANEAPANEAVAAEAPAGEAAAPGSEAYHQTLESYYSNKTFEYGFNSMCKMTLPDFLSGKTVLDIGCRRGRGVFKLSDRVGITGHVVGIDWSRDFINEAKHDMDRAWQDSGLPESNMEFYWGFPEDLASMGLRDNSMDLVFTNSILNLAYDSRQVLHEIFRVLRYGGLLICETVLATGPRDQRVVDQARSMGNSVQSAMSQEEFERILAEEGFSITGLSYRDVHKVNPTDGYIMGYSVDAVPSDEGVEFKAVVAHVVKPKANVLPRAIIHNGGMVDQNWKL